MTKDPVGIIQKLSNTFVFVKYAIALYQVLFGYIGTIGSANTFFWKMILKKTTEYFSKISFFYLKIESFRLIMENDFIQMAA